MNVIVLVKQVPSTESMIAINADGKSADTGDAKMEMNPYDEFAVEEALQIKKQYGGTVRLLSVGGDRTVETLRIGLAMGADTATLITDPETAGCDGLGIARILATAIKGMACDLVIAGQRAVDDDNYLVGPAVAELLGIPHISMVVKEEITDNTLKCTRTVEGGTVTYEVPLPALFTTQRGLNEPRYPSMPGIMKAKKKKIETMTLADLGLTIADLAPKTEILAMRTPPERTAGKMIDGATAQEKAAALVKALHEEAKVI